MLILTLKSGVLSLYPSELNPSPLRTTTCSSLALHPKSVECGCMAKEWCFALSLNDRWMHKLWLTQYKCNFWPFLPLDPPKVWVSRVIHDTVGQGILGSKRHSLTRVIDYFRVNEAWLMLRSFSCEKQVESDLLHSFTITVMKGQDSDGVFVVQYKPLNCSTDLSSKNWSSRAMFTE